MIEHSPHSSNLHGLWQQHRTMVLLVFAGLAALAYYLYRQNQANASATSTAPAQTGPTVSNVYVQRNVSVQGPTPAAPPPTTGSTPTGPNPWLQGPPPSVSPATWNPYANGTTPVSQQWPRPSNYVSYWTSNAPLQGGTYVPTY